MEARYLALCELWWIRWRDVDPVRSALLAAHALHFDRVLLRLLEKNKRKNRRPDSYISLALMLERDVASLFRWRGGETEMARLDVDAVADALGTDVGALFPTREEKIAVAASILGGYEFKKYPKLAPEPKAYAAYRFAEPTARNGELDENALETVVIAMRRELAPAQSVKDLVWDVVRKLEPKLEQASLANPRYR